MKSETPLRDITAAARAGLSGNWGTAVGMMVVYSILVQGVNLLPGLGSLLMLLYCGPLLVGIASFFIAVCNGAPRFSQLFDGFDLFGKSLGAYLLMMLFLMLWMLLIIPGIIKTYSYAMTFYIIADDPSVGAAEAITRSRQIMDGNKFRLFCLYLRFIGWSFLCLFTFGIGYLWLIPYMNAAQAAFYEDIK
jgi:uncharacterized membrane protein